MTEWKLVPVEPTKEMIDAAKRDGHFSSVVQKAWATMIAAAPKAPSEPILDGSNTDNIAAFLHGVEPAPLDELIALEAIQDAAYWRRRARAWIAARAALKEPCGQKDTKK